MPSLLLSYFTFQFIKSIVMNCTDINKTMNISLSKVDSKNCFIVFIKGKLHNLVDCTVKPHINSVFTKVRCFNRLQSYSVRTLTLFHQNYGDLLNMPRTFNSTWGIVIRHTFYIH